MKKLILLFSIAFSLHAFAQNNHSIHYNNPDSCLTPPPVAVVGASCGPSVLYLGAANCTQYLWYNSATGDSVIHIGFTYTTPLLTQTTTYYVSNFDSCESVRVPVLASIIYLTAEAGTNQTITCGDSVTLTSNVTYNGTDTLSYEWIPVSGLNSTTIANPSASPQQTTIYTMQVTDGMCTAYVYDTIIVNPANYGVNFTANAQLFTAPPFNVQLTNTTPNISKYNFTWYFGDGTSLQSNNITVTHQYAQNGTYDVTLEATNIVTGCTDLKYQEAYIICSGGSGCNQSANITQANPVNGCAGTPVVLNCNTVAGANYQWNYNGTTIAGNDTSFYYAYDPGIYSVTIILASCPVTSSDVTVNMNTPPPIPTITSNGNISYCVAGGSDTLSAPNGASSYLWSTGDTTQSIIVGTSGNYTVIVSDAIGCTSQSEPYNIGASPITPPELCVVSLDSATGHNILIWRKPAATPVNHFNIYRQGTITTAFNLLASVSYDSTSIYLDTSSDPALQAYQYELSIVDTCGAETPLSSSHKTMHLSLSQGSGNTINLSWNDYEGFSFPSYNIYRGTSPANLTLLTSVASTLNTYTDSTPPAGEVYYQIEAVNPSPCSSRSSEVMNTPNYSTTKSNMVNENNVITGMHNYVNNLTGISIYPDPATNCFTIEIQNAAGGTKQEAVVEITNIKGQTILQQQIQQRKTNIDISGLAKGVYILRINSNDRIEITRIVKE